MHFNNQSLNNHLRRIRIQFADDLADLAEVLWRGTDDQGVLLKAADGRNITFDVATALVTNRTGLVTAGTFVGTYSVYTLDGSAIKV